MAKLPVVKLPSKRWWIPVSARLEGAESRGGVPDRRPGVFEHSRHSVWLLWHLNSVSCTQRWTNANDKMTARTTFFSQNITHREKYSKYSVVDPSKKVPDLNCEVQDLLLEVVDLKQEVSDLRSGVIPPQFNPCKLQARM